MADEKLTGIKILIVEDDPSSKLYLNKILEKTGALIYNASDGVEAVKTTLENPGLDIILMDLQLPVMDGYLATRKIRETGKDIIIIAQTAYGLASDMEEILTSGFDDYLIKPIYSDQLIGKIRSFMSKK